MENLRFTFSEVLSLIGVFQCVYVIVHVFFRAGNARQVILPALFFFTLSVAFFGDLARGYVSELFSYYEVMSWVAWTMIIPLSVLLIIQMAQIKKIPSVLNWLVLLVVPLALIGSYSLTSSLYGECDGYVGVCPPLIDWLNVSTVVAGAVALLVIWARRGLFAGILDQPAGRERYWLILALIIVNVAFLIFTAFLTTGYTLNFDPILMRTVLGLGFVYLVSTSMFRIYPSALFTDVKPVRKDFLGQDDQSLIDAIERLIAMDKVYHEPSYSRSDLAKELNVPEASISRIINLHYKKSFPKLLNEHRVEDAKRLLLDTDAEMGVIATEVGFNSMTSFNRAFKDCAKQSPSSYRNNMIK